MWAAAQFLFSIYAAPEPNQGTVAPIIDISPPSKYKTKVIPHSHAQRSVSQVILESAKFDNTNHHGYESKPSKVLTSSDSGLMTLTF